MRLCTTSVRTSVASISCDCHSVLSDKPYLFISMGFGKVKETVNSKNRIYFADMFVKKTMEELERKSPSEAKGSGKKNPIIIILDDIRSMHNVGSVFRTGDAFAVSAI